MDLAFLFPHDKSFGVTVQKTTKWQRPPRELWGHSAWDPCPQRSRPRAPTAHLVEQEFIQVLELIGVGDLAEHGLSPLLRHRDFANLEVSVLFPFPSQLLGVLLTCGMTVLVAGGDWRGGEEGRRGW